MTFSEQIDDKLRQLRISRERALQIINQPGYPTITLRTLQNYLAGTQVPPFHAQKGMLDILQDEIDIRAMAKIDEAKQK